ncbi:MAG: hypothetical protein KatS3mg061_1280 [Dehalococcoidia bacterium]|nr:MAG: hypothetical protein KatS3mg061_1280 [Dehalococcoidia bacterium]
MRIGRPIRVLLVEPDHSRRDTIRRLVQSARDLQLMGLASSGEEALPLLVHGCPDVVVIARGLPGMSGLEAVRRLRTTACTPAVVLLTPHPISPDEARATGVSSALHGNASRDRLLSAIRRAALSQGRGYPSLEVQEVL